MYNLYTYEKQLNQIEKEKKEIIKERNLKKKRKKELDKLTQNYNDRMNEFIFSMCENPILLEREDNPNNNNKKIIKTKDHFFFGYFKTDKERLESMEEEKKLLEKYDEKRRKDEKKRNILKIKSHKDYIIIQPKMRFNSRTKLENIIEIIKKKEESANIDIYNNSLMEQIKRLKYNDITKMKEYYNLFDKEKLNTKYIKQAIKKMDEMEQNNNINEYTFKNYIDWKYQGKINYNDDDKDSNNNKNLPQKNLQYNNISEIIEVIGNNKNKQKEKKNEFECLVKNDFKTHFKGASQYISLKNLDDFKTNKVNRFTNHKYNFEDIRKNKRAMSAMKLTNKSIKNFLKDKNNNKTNNENIEHINKIENKRKIKNRPASVKVNKNNEKKYILKNAYSLKDLSEVYKKKKVTMDELINKELNKSIVNKYINKYDLINEFNKSGNINPDTFALQNNFHFLEEKDEKLKEKLAYLKEEIARENKLKDKDKYKQFVRRFARSSSGFMQKDIIDKIDEYKGDTKKEYIVIDNKVFQKKDVKDISDFIFQKCNFYKRKSIHNETSLVKNSGKLMFTSGLTLNDFSSKYNL